MKDDFWKIFLKCGLRRKLSQQNFCFDVLRTCVVTWMRMTPMGSNVWILGSHQWKCLERIGRYNLVGKDVSLGWALRCKKTLVLPSVLCGSCPWIKMRARGHSCCHSLLCSSLRDSNLLKLWAQLWTQLTVFFYKWPWSSCLITVIEK